MYIGMHMFFKLTNLVVLLLLLLLLPCMSYPSNTIERKFAALLHIQTFFILDDLCNL